MPIRELEPSPVIHYLKLLGRIQQVILGLLDQLFDISGHATACAESVVVRVHQGSVVLGGASFFGE